MLALARARIDQSGLRNVQLRQGDIYAPPVERGGYDLVVIHQVLHFLDDPARAIAEAARALRPGGRLIVVDFLAHDQEFLRQDYAHRHLGFTIREVEAFLMEAGLAPLRTHQILPAPGEPDKLTVAIWLAGDARLQIAEPGAGASVRYTTEIA
jgi:SAM-dependent methyltransferase